METKSPKFSELRPFRSVHGVLFALCGAIGSEFILGSFLNSGPHILSSLARILLVFLLLYTIHRFSLLSLSNYKPRPRDGAMVTLILFGSIFLIWLGKVLSFGVAQYAQTSDMGLHLDPELLYFGIPYASGALLLQAILGLHYGLVFSLSLSVIVGTYEPTFPLLAPYALATCLIACLSLSRFRSRSSYLKAGFNVALMAIPFALVHIILQHIADPILVVLPILGAVIGGILSAFVASGLTPIAEALGGYSTDMRLIEMATLDHPLLKELSIQAPGTWNHSMVMGMMVETAADAVGANSVLARVGAYFHDIGKMKKPLYFVENQGGGENRHDKLSTSMSALIIRSHVKDGIELARKHKLPQAIVDMVPQHHGTSTIEYFFDKAKKEAQEAGEGAVEVDRSLYTYPGPKPQTREAGILMLADGIEAAARTLSDPSPDRIQGMVQKLINKVFASGELNECDLTLRDLHLIAKSFTRVLTSIYHQRIAYAEPVEKGAEKLASGKQVTPAKTEPEKGTTSPKDKEVDGGGTPEEEGAKSDEEKPSETRPEDLKRLGI